MVAHAFERWVPTLANQIGELLQLVRLGQQLDHGIQVGFKIPSLRRRDHLRMPR